MIPPGHETTGHGEERRDVIMAYACGGVQRIRKHGRDEKSGPPPGNRHRDPDGDGY